ncbi:Uncharacterised protein [Mycobacteroides abscessus]|nr:Uncharacterised protein [Mycobacteroides abscessus]
MQQLKINLVASMVCNSTQKYVTQNTETIYFVTLYVVYVTVQVNGQWKTSLRLKLKKFVIKLATVKSYVR